MDLTESPSSPGSDGGAGQERAGTPVSSSPSDRSAEARLSRLHLRGGLLSLARAALEQMAGAGTLDREAMADLAEARWRSGDLEGAAEAARAHQASGGQEPVAALILAEDLARQGRQPDALRVAEWVYGSVGGAVDVLFAGEPRSPAWPPPDPGWMDAEASARGRLGLLVGGSEVAAPDPESWRPVPIRDAEPAGEAHSHQPAGALGVPVGRGGPTRPGGPGNTTAGVISGRIAGEELAAVDAGLAAGRTAAAVERLAVLLRLDPALAPLILSAADRAVATARPGEGLVSTHLVRGDAYRILGRDNEAAAAYQQAHLALEAGPANEEDR